MPSAAAATRNRKAERVQRSQGRREREDTEETEAMSHSLSQGLALYQQSHIPGLANPHLRSEMWGTRALIPGSGHTDPGHPRLHDESQITED